MDPTTHQVQSSTPTRRDPERPLSVGEAREARRDRRARRRADAELEGREHSPLWSTWIEHQDYFHCLCMRWVRGNRHDAEDVMSEAAIKLMELDHERAAEVQNPRSWISRVLHNLCADLGRKGVRARAIEEIWSTLGASSCERAPDAQLHDTRVGARVVAAVDDLQECLRSVLVMRLVDGLSYKEIADLLGITSATARKRAQLGRDALKLRLTEVFETSTAPTSQEA